MRNSNAVRILLAADPDAFASLILLDSKWRATSQQPHLYSHQLAQCPSYATAHTDVPPADEDSLPLLRRLFAREVKRNLFEAYLRPRQTLVKLVSNSISSSSCPGGEGMYFGSSPRGHHILAYNSSRIYVIAVHGEGLRVKRELKIQRRPVSACITDDAGLLAVLSQETQVDVYDLQPSPPRLKQSVLLDNSPRTITISSCGSVLAAAYDGGVEVSALGAAALPTEKRAVKCDAVDSLSFSLDGTQILGTTIHSSPPSTVVLTAPYYDPSNQVMDDNVSAMWTTSILFPNTSRDCSHAILLPDGDRRESEWTFTYDRSFETFRAVRLDDLRNGTTYFTGPTPQPTSLSKLMPCTLPATTERGELVSAGFQGKDVWIYGVPEDLDAVPEPMAAAASADASCSSSGLGRNSSVQSNVSRRTSSRGGRDADTGRVPQWQILCDKLRNNLVAGAKVAELSGVGSVKWVSNFGDSSVKERLVVMGSGVMGPRFATDEEDIDFVDGGRVILLDFDYGLDNGKETEITIEVGSDNAEPLEEERRDMETEVAIVRRRTVAKQRGGGGSTALLRAATTASSRAEALPPARERRGDTSEGLADNDDDDDDDPLVPRVIGRLPPIRRRPVPETHHEEDEEVASIEEQEALDAPYAHSSPRSGTTLRRAATAAAVNRQLYPRTADGRPIQYRRADGRNELPHESDADNWVPPPPPYQRNEDPVDLPVFMRAPAIAPLDSPPRRRHRRASDSTDISRTRVEQILRPRSTPSVHSARDSALYDVSPQASPRPTAALTTESGSGLARATSAASHHTASGSERHSYAHPAYNVSPTASTAPTRPSVESGNEVSQGSPALALQIPPTSMNTTVYDPSPSRRLPNSHTWPRQLASSQPTTAHPNTAPPSNMTSNDFAATLPPAPSSNQLASLNKRVSQGNPRRLSGQLLQGNLWTSHANRRSMTAPSPAMQSFQPAARPPSMPVPEFDRPLIVSSPAGVGGGFDQPEKGSGSVQTPLLAPVPRHPRPTASSTARPAVERLENLYGDRPPHQPPQQQQQQVWRTSSRARRTPSRRKSRAGRSAARHMADAKKRWKLGRSNDSQANGKQSKCVVM